jgi:tRNA dimethylallyltransferase
MKKPSLVVVTGPTAVGKTEVAIALAGHYQTEILSADSRQFYRGMEIGTAAPDAAQLKLIRHHFVGFLEPGGYYNVSLFEKQALEVLSLLFMHNQIAVCTGGSGLYIDVLCSGIDDLPDPDHVVRASVEELHRLGGLAALQEKLSKLDPEYYSSVDLSNPARIRRAIEVCLQTGKKFSELRSGHKGQRPFGIIKIGLNLPRPELFERIRLRVDEMLARGLLEEVRRLTTHRHTNALNTVGYKELFTYLDGHCTLAQAVEKICTNTRRYAKRQLTWLMRDPDVKWFHPDDIHGMHEYIRVKRMGC